MAMYNIVWELLQLGVEPRYFETTRIRPYENVPMFQFEMFRLL